MRLKLLNVFLSGLLSIFLLGANAKAQEFDAGMGVSVPVDDAENLAAGSIVCRTDVGIGLCLKPFDSGIFGVVSDNPALEINHLRGVSERLVITSGTVKVRVIGITGSIKTGDLVTSSEIPGAGQLSDGFGHVLGVAVTEFTPDDRNGEGQVLVALRIGISASSISRRSNIMELLRKGLTSSVLEPLDSLRYLLAALVLVLSLVLGMVYFGRVSRAGVEAIGRNPLAKKSIEYGVLLSVALTLVIILTGLGLAYLILVL